MFMNNNSFQVLEHIFKNQITVKSISIPTKSVPYDEAVAICHKNNFDLHLVVESESSEKKVYDRNLGKVRAVVENEIITESTSLLEVIRILSKNPHLFIKEGHSITSIVTSSDLDSIPVRIWLFGMISLFEILLRQEITINQIEWKECITKNRLDQAKGLYFKKRERNEEIDLLSCTQIVDLADIICKSWNYYLTPGFDFNKNEFKSKLVRLNKLRDEIAHSQKFTSDWKEILEMMDLIDKFGKSVNKISL